MRCYALLLAPGANRVYGRSAPALGRSELAVINRFGLAGRLSDLAEQHLGGVAYLTFSANGLDGHDIDVLSNLSGVFALFERLGDHLLRPIELSPLDRWDDDLITIQRYRGKTNEQFTKLLMNLAVVVGHGGDGFRSTGARLRVVDPLCGRGTALNQAVMYGFDAAGIESDERDVDAYVNFFTTWLQNKRVKHHVEREKVRRDGHGPGQRVTITFSATKEEQKQRVVVIADDTVRAVNHLGKNSMDALVVDLPYGVQHGSQAGAELSRRPSELLSLALPVWRSLLRPGAAMAVAWNTKTLKRAALIEAVEAAGLEPVNEGDEWTFCHRVDSSITRDVMIARRPRSGWTLDSLT